MTPLTLGTAGHIDHGKTALVAALTGVDTDRLPAEKARGISIELGYAPLALPSGRRLSVVDVPGHERFVRTMVAGATGIDLYLMVVAADDGVMPQTLEHAAVLAALGVGDGVVAVTKADLADPARAQREARRAAPAGRGRARARRARAPGSRRCARPSTRSPPACPGAARAPATPLLHVDRAFTIRGAGTVVTGTLWSGAVARRRPPRAAAGGHAGARARRCRSTTSPSSARAPASAWPSTWSGSTCARSPAATSSPRPGALAPSLVLDCELDAARRAPRDARARAPRHARGGRAAGRPRRRAVAGAPGAARCSPAPETASSCARSRRPTRWAAASSSTRGAPPRPPRRRARAPRAPASRRAGAGARAPAATRAARHPRPPPLPLARSRSRSACARPATSRRNAPTSIPTTSPPCAPPGARCASAARCTRIPRRWRRCARASRRSSRPRARSRWHACATSSDLAQVRPGAARAPRRRARDQAPARRLARAAPPLGDRSLRGVATAVPRHPYRRSQRSRMLRPHRLARRTVLAWSTRWRMPPPGGGSSAASAAEMVSVTRARRCARPRARRRSACRLGVDDDAVEDVLAPGLLRAAHRSHLDAIRRAHRRPARHDLVGDRLAVVVCHGPPGCHASVAGSTMNTVLVTGATDGLGRALATRLAGEGDTVLAHARSEERARRARRAARRAGRRAARRRRSGLARRGARARRPVPDDASTCSSTTPASASPGGPAMVSADGYELRFAVNYLAGFLLAALLRARLAAARRPVSSTSPRSARRRSTSTT